MKRLAPLVLGPMVVAIGVGKLALLARRRHRFAQAQGWRGVPGVVTEAYTFSDPDRSGIENIRIVYEYDTDAGTLSGQTPRACGEWFRSAAARREYLARYPVWSDVEVFYDPARPDRSCIDRDSTDGFRHELVFALAVIAFGAALTAGGYWAWVTLHSR